MKKERISSRQKVQALLARTNGLVKIDDAQEILEEKNPKYGLGFKIFLATKPDVLEALDKIELELALAQNIRGTAVNENSKRGAIEEELKLIPKAREAVVNGLEELKTYLKVTVNIRNKTFRDEYPELF